MNIIDFLKFCQDYRIDYDQSKRGWISIRCPFCSDKGRHFGYNLEKGYGFCLRCGWHPVDLTIQSLTGSSKMKAKALVSLYELIPGSEGVWTNRETENLIHVDHVRWPDGCGPMTDSHKLYLLNRGFDPDELEREWELKGTGNWGGHSFRVIVPIFFDGEVVSWQGRDITDEQGAKYLPCPKEWEVLPYKHLLYGLDKAKWKKAVVVEGVTGVWRLGQGSIGTFGATWTLSQLLLISKTFDEVLIFFDGDEAGKRAAEKMFVSLEGLGKEAEILEPMGCDSGNISQDEADEIMEEVRK